MGKKNKTKKNAKSKKTPATQPEPQHDLVTELLEEPSTLELGLTGLLLTEDGN